MTTNKKAKTAARVRQQATGESYAEARRRTLVPEVGAVERLFEDDHCANCLAPLPLDVEGLFCSSWCRETADVVRYWRGTIRDGRLEKDPLVLQAIRTQVAFLLIGGYDRLGRALSTKVKADVRERDSGLCRECGKPGTEIDHIAGSSGDLANLQLLCGECHRAKTAQNLAPAPADKAALIQLLFLARVVPDEPTLLADDQVAWRHRWQGLKRARKQRLIDRMEGMGIETTGLRSWADLVEVYEDCLADDIDGVGGTDDFDGGYGPNSYFARAMAKDD
jgi:5-methylcytosine-specific restriction endonuclease McrA